MIRLRSARRHSIVALFFGVFTMTLAAFAGSSGAPSADAARWMPKPSPAAWQIQLQGKIDTSINAEVFDVDGFGVSRKTVDELHAQGRNVLCYIDVGSWEEYRSDRNQFPETVIGKRYEGFPNERWLDIRKFHRFAKPLKARIAMCARKGFDGLDPDNLAGFQNDTGFPLTFRDQLRFNRWIARQAHRRGLSIALKNDGSQARQLAKNFDFAIVEQCFQYNECGRYLPFIRADKAVFEIEYETPSAEFCGKAKKLKFNAIGKEYNLFARPFRPCVGG